MLADVSRGHRPGEGTDLGGTLTWGGEKPNWRGHQPPAQAKVKGRTLTWMGRTLTWGEHRLGGDTKHQPNDEGEDTDWGNDTDLLRGTLSSRISRSEGGTPTWRRHLPGGGN